MQIVYYTFVFRFLHMVCATYSNAKFIQILHCYCWDHGSVWHTYFL